MTLFSNIQVVTVNKGWLYGLTKLKQLSLAHNQVGHCPQHLQENAHHSFFVFWSTKVKDSLYFQVDYIEDDGWDFCSALWQLNLQGNQVCHSF